MDVFSIFKIVFVGVALLAGTLVSIFVPKKYHDTKVEKVAEKVVESITGIDIDLTPNSPEPEDFVETFTLSQEGDEDVFSDYWDKYFDEYDKARQLVQREESFPVEKLIY